MLISVTIYVNDRTELENDENIKQLEYIGKYIADDIDELYEDGKTEYNIEYAIGDEEEDD